MARHFGGSAWRVILAGQVGSFIQWILKQGKTCCRTKKSNEMYYGESVDCDIIM
jgi:hypothetical protein